VNILAIETSCDETAAAVISDGRRVRSNVVWSQLAAHQRYGGVVPELAARAHLTAIGPVVRDALSGAEAGWDGIDAIAVTNRPGLSGALLVGVNAAKGVALARNLPLVGVHHIEGHIAANWLIDELQDHGEIAMPAVCLIVSGGHTDLIRMKAPGQYELLGTTLDDAAGEAFDKGARLLGLGYPGGPAIQHAAEIGDPGAIPFPRAWLNDSFDFSFSGLKTALLRLVEPYRVEPAHTPAPVREPFATHIPPSFREGMPVADLAAGFQEAIVDVLVRKTIAAAQACQARTVVLAGGVAANSRLRWTMERAVAEPDRPLRLVSPRLTYCTDNAAMIGAAAHWAIRRGEIAGYDLDVIAREPLTRKG
jgi:tRNA N6-adenosine threonylcarbamoyltransferase